MSKGSVLLGFLALAAILALADTSSAQGLLISAEQDLYGRWNMLLENPRGIPTGLRPLPVMPTVTTESPIITAVRRPLIPPSLFNRLPPSKRPSPNLGWVAFPISLR